MSSLRGARMSGKRRRSADDLARLVDRERGLRHVGELRPGGQVERLHLVDRLDEDRRLRCLPCRADDLLVPGVADEDDRVPLLGVPPSLDVHLRDEGTRRVDDVVPERPRVVVHGRRHAVRRVHDRRALGRLRLLLDEDRPSRLEVTDDVDVVDDLLADVDGRAIVVERLLDRLDGALDAGAVAARRGQEDSSHGTGTAVSRRGAATGPESGRLRGSSRGRERRGAPDPGHARRRVLAASA